MAKKTTKVAAPKKAARKTTGAKVSAVRKKDIPKGLEHLEGLHDYYNSKSKKELTPFMETTMQKLKDLKHDAPIVVSEWESMDEEFNSLTDKPKDFPKALEITGRLVSQLNYLLNLKK